MKLSQFTDLLESNADKPFLLVLPTGATVPVSFHITEVAHVTKKFLDCGGKLHVVETCQLQVWVWSDTDHRLHAGKMARVIGKARTMGVLPVGADLDVEFEYEHTATSTYTVETFAVESGAVVFRLAPKHTDCLAKDVCLPVLPMLASADGDACCAPGCC
ncbi:MAG TPA: DUF6428 family protein [Capsulimonadaceae bacterium]|jgi:hypothetical protein